MGTPSRTRRMLAGAVALAAVAAGCSDDDDTNGQATEAETEAEALADPAAPSAGCEGPGTDEADLVEAEIELGDTARRYLVSAPAWEEGGEPLPLLIDFHGLGEGADVHAEMTQLGPIGAEEGFITVFPHGTGEPVAWNVTPDIEANDDLAFVAELLDSVEEERCIDTARIYATGLSNGAMMTSTVACTMADRIAAVAPVAGITLPEPCDPQRPVPVLAFHGTDDPILLFNGGVNAAALDAAFGRDEGSTTSTTQAADLDGDGYPATVQEWAGLNGCDGGSQDEQVSDEVIRRTYDCPSDAPVEFLIIEGGGHSWPSSEFSRSIEEIVGHTTFDVDGSREVWEFVRQFHLPEA